MTNLNDFLLARIAEDEAVAFATQSAHDPLDWGNEHDLPAHGMAGPSDGPSGYTCVIIDPARVLAECDAKRRIVEWHKSWPVLVERPPTFDPIDSNDPSTFAMRASQQMAWTTEQAYRDHFGTEPPTGPILRFLALPYADHPDYREEWKP